MSEYFNFMAGKLSENNCKGCTFFVSSIKSRIIENKYSEKNFFEYWCVQN